MKIRQFNILLGGCLAISFMVHLLIIPTIGQLGALDFSLPGRSITIVDMNLEETSLPKTDGPASSPLPAKSNVPKVMTHHNPAASAEPNPAKIVPPVLDTTDNPPVSARNENEIHVPTDAENNADAEEIPLETVKQSIFEPDPPLRFSGEFLRSSHEKLTYRISLLDLPVGSAELEAQNINGEVRITLWIKSDSAFSTIYPVNNLIETRHINGNFILTRIRQQEGAFRGDRGFTIFLRDQKVFWINRLTHQSSNEPLPNSEVVDILSGLYYLRNRPLKVGTSETLHIYDSDSYASIPVLVVRNENVMLPAFRTIKTLLVQPQMKKGGIFWRTGDVQIWLSDDQYKVPVKIETTTVIGQITVELMSAESKRPDSSEIQNDKAQ